IEPRQLGTKRLDARRNHMVGIPLGADKGLEFLCINPDAVAPGVLLGVVLLPALSQQCSVVVVAVSLMATPVDAATSHGELKRDTARLVGLLDPAQQLECLGSATAITERLRLSGP